MSALDDLVSFVNEAAARLRDENRPSIEHAADVITDMVHRAVSGAMVGTRMNPKERGPDRWSWVSEDGMRELSLTGSAHPAAIGHPLLTMRQVLCDPLDNQVTTSQLVIGSMKEQIAASVLTLLTNHAAAAAGISAISKKSVLSDDICAELDRIEGNSPVPTLEDVEVLDRRARSGKDDGSMN